MIAYVQATLIDRTSTNTAGPADDALFPILRIPTIDGRIPTIRFIPFEIGFAALLSVLIVSEPRAMKITSGR